jgi:hypothetical protein
MEWCGRSDGGKVTSMVCVGGNEYCSLTSEVLCCCFHVASSWRAFVNVLHFVWY